MVSDSLTYYPVLAFVLGGMGAGAVVALAAHLPAFFIYLLLSILPFSARLAAEGGIEHLAMSGMLFVYTIAMLALGRRHHASLLQSLALRFENADLLRTLEQRVEERTQELQDINQRLSRDIAERERAEAALHLQGQRQAALVAFGERALSSADLDAVLKEAAAIAAHGLRVPHTAVLERLANGSALVMRAGVGWPMGVVGCATHATEARALGRGPIGGIRAVEVIVPSGRRPFGVLGAYTAEPRMFSPDDIAFLQSVANTLAAAIQRKRAEDNIHKLALQDPLTGLPNRILFHNHLGQALARVTRSGGLLAVLLLDLDCFKDVNDTLGHPIGDRLLKETAKRLRACVRACVWPTRPLAWAATSLQSS